MLDRLFLASGGIEYVGSVTKSAADAEDFDSPAEALDVLSIAQTGDLVVIAFSFSNTTDASWSWQGMSFSDVFSSTAVQNPGAYAGYRFVQSGDTNPYVSGANGNWNGLSIVASVFRGASSFSSGASANNSSGMPDPPLLTATGALWAITGHIDDDVVTNWAAPANYTLAAYETIGNGISTATSSTAIAYRIETLSSNNPGAFTGSGNDDWRASTSAYL